MSCRRRNALLVQARDGRHYAEGGCCSLLRDAIGVLVHCCTFSAGNAPPETLDDTAPFELRHAASSCMEC